MQHSVCLLRRNRERSEKKPSLHRYVLAVKSVIQHFVPQIHSLLIQRQ